MTYPTGNSNVMICSNKLYVANKTDKITEALEKGRTVGQTSRYIRFHKKCVMFIDTSKVVLYLESVAVGVLTSLDKHKKKEI
jgi:hypothetical protein